jgi:hypothetical protein
MRRRDKLNNRKRGTEMRSAIFNTPSSLFCVSIKGNLLTCDSTEVRKMRWVEFIKYFNSMFKFSATHNLLIIHNILNRGHCFLSNFSR